MIMLIFINTTYHEKMMNSSCRLEEIEMDQYNLSITKCIDHTYRTLCVVLSYIYSCLFDVGNE